MVHSSQYQQTPDSTDGASQARSPANWAFRLLAVITGTFIFTIFVMIAVMMADPEVPVNRALSAWFDRNALTLITIQVGLIAVLMVVAFRIDRKAGLEKYQRELEAYEARMTEKLDPNSKTQDQPE